MPLRRSAHSSKPEAGTLLHRRTGAKLGLAFLLACAAHSPTMAQAHRAESARDVVSSIISDMTLPNDGHPAGVPPNVDWANRPRVNWGANPHGFRAVLAWGHVFREEGARPDSSRIEVRNIRLYLLSKSTQRWRLIEHSEGVKGAAYSVDVGHNIHHPIRLVREPDGGTSARIPPGYYFHFWPATPRTPLDPSDVMGLLTIFEGRLIPADPQSCDVAPGYLMAAGADYWIDPNASWAHFKTNDDAGIGRMKRVTCTWQTFSMATPKAQVLASHPPPVN